MNNNFEIKITGFRNKEDVENFIEWYKDIGQDSFCDFLYDYLEDSDEDKNLGNFGYTDINTNKWEDNQYQMNLTE